MQHLEKQFKPIISWTWMIFWGLHTPIAPLRERLMAWKKNHLIDPGGFQGSIIEATMKSCHRFLFGRRRRTTNTTANPRHVFVFCRSHRTVRDFSETRWGRYEWTMGSLGGYIVVILGILSYPNMFFPCQYTSITWAIIIRYHKSQGLVKSSKPPVGLNTLGASISNKALVYSKSANQKNTPTPPQNWGDHPIGPITNPNNS